MKYKGVLVGEDNDGHPITSYSNSLENITEWARKALRMYKYGTHVEIYELTEKKVGEVKREEVMD